MALSVGSRLGHYDVTALIGEGGMGQARALLQSPDPMRFAVVNQEPPVRINRHAVRPVELTVERIVFWTVTPHSGAEHRRDDPARFVVQCGFRYLGSADPVKRSPLESWDAPLVEQIEEIAVFERQCSPERRLFDVEMRVEASQPLDVVVDDEEPGVGV